VPQIVDQHSYAAYVAVPIPIQGNPVKQAKSNAWQVVRGKHILLSELSLDWTSEFWIKLNNPGSREPTPRLMHSHSQRCRPLVLLKLSRS